MRFECKDLQRALAVPELMVEAREHARDCSACRAQLWVWQQISAVAPQLRKDWESPDLWPRIQQALEREAGARPQRRPGWHWIAAVAALVVIAIGVGLVVSGRPRAASPDFLTESALAEVERSEAAYAKSIEKLSQLVTPKLRQETSALAASYREKLVVLDSAIKDMGATLDQNPYNAYLRTELAALLREKQKTLQELLNREQKN